jgi:hypothetical protein
MQRSIFKTLLIVLGSVVMGIVLLLGLIIFGIVQLFNARYSLVCQEKSRLLSTSPNEDVRVVEYSKPSGDCQEVLRKLDDLYNAKKMDESSELYRTHPTNYDKIAVQTSSEMRTYDSVNSDAVVVSLHTTSDLSLWPDPVVWKDTHTLKLQFVCKGDNVNHLNDVKTSVGSITIIPVCKAASNGKETTLPKEE